MAHPMHECRSQKTVIDIQGLSDADAAAESIGVDVPEGGAGLSCEIDQARRRFRVGDQPLFEVRIRNRGRTPVLLPFSLDGSDHGRYPNATLTFQGPRDAFHVPPILRCGNLSALLASDFVEVRPGDSFDPFAHGFRPDLLHHGKFVKPGRYVATFRYSTNQRDVRKWVGGFLFPVTIGAELSRTLRRVPLVELECSVEFDVKE